jgi:hypothetical protein
MACEITGCPHPAAGLHTWGFYPAGDRNKDVPLCPACLAAVWAEIKGPVANGLCHYAARAIPPAKE